MARDRNGIELKVGDMVLLPCKIVNVTPDGDLFNLGLETVIPLPGADKGSYELANSRQVRLAGGLERIEFERAEAAESVIPPHVEHGEPVG